MASVWANEAFLHSFVDEGEQRVIVSIYIQQSYLQNVRIPGPLVSWSVLVVSNILFRVADEEYRLIMDA